ncbi:MAG: SelB C-terminal domain-containing protein [Micromonosporaceae bacterium]
MHVIATAGHVDHGKSALVRALTGMEPDRWAEEIRRGMTIDLGFCWTSLAEGIDIAFVDVPGHERFVANMLAGVGPAPAVLFVVAADEGWRAQSAEHLAAIDALGVRHGLLAVTRSDLASPQSAMADATERIARSSLGEVESVAVSSVTGEGLAELRAALGRLAGALPPPDTAADVRLWADRSFTITGHGLVVTGTLTAGTISAGDELMVVPGDRRVRVRGLQALRENRTRVAAAARVAVNLRDRSHHLDPGDVRRGSALVAPGRWLTTTVADVRLSGPGPHELPGEMMLHIGTSGTGVRVRPLGGDTARLTLGAPLPLRIGDSAVLRYPGRNPGKQLIVAGVTVLDVLPPPLRRRGAAAVRAVELAGMTGDGDAAAELRRRKLARRADLAAMGAPPRGQPIAGDWMADPGWWCELGGRLRDAVEAHAGRHPLEPGLPAETARRQLGLPDRRLVEALVRAPLVYEGGKIYGSGAAPGLPPGVHDAVEVIRADLGRHPFVAPDAIRLRELRLGSRQLAAAVRAGYLLRVSQEVYLLPGADEQAVRILAALPQPFTLSQARQALATTRRVAVPLLEMLDRTGRTERLDESLRRVR